MKNSLQRLQLDYVDIVFCHRFDYDGELEDICRSMHELVASGKACYWGTSEWPAAYISAAIEICRKYGWHPPVAEQNQYNMLVRQKMESDYIPLFTRYKYGTTVWSPLAGGLLSGKYNDGKNDNGRLKDEKFWGKHMSEKKREQNLKILNRLGEFAKSIGATQSQLALAWTIANSATSTCILGATQKEQLDENVKAVELAERWNKEWEAKIEEILDNRPTPDDNYKYDAKQALTREKLLNIK